MQSHALTVVCAFKVPSTSSHIIVWTHYTTQWVILQEAMWLPKMAGELITVSYAIRLSESGCITAIENRSGELQTQKLKSHLVRTQSLNVLPLKPGVGQCIAIHATLTARNFFLAYFYPSSAFTCIFSKNFPSFSCVGCG